MKNKVLFTLNKISGLLLLFGVMMADSDSNIPLSMIAVGTIWLAIFGAVNKEWIERIGKEL